MRDVEKKYKDNLARLQKHLDKLLIVNKVFIVSKLVLIAAVLFLIYKWLYTQNNTMLWGALIVAALFAILFSVDLRFLKKLQIAKQKCQVFENELDALNGRLDAFDAGLEFHDSTHEYAFDLDIFSSGGLYRHVNRTVTAEGKQLLAHWMKKTDIEPDEIINRQKLVGALLPQFSWRMHYLAIGSIENMDLGQIATHFRSAAKIGISPLMKVIVYALVGLTMLALVANIANLLGTHIWLTLFIINLLVVGAWLKQTSGVYGKLGKAYKVMLAYHDLLKHVEGVDRSDEITDLINPLIKGSKSCLVAFNELRKLLGRFDQRNNILIALAMNGFILSDLLLLMRYNRWINKYGHLIDDYLKAVAHLDVVVSLATYADNHPQYVTPQIDMNGVFDAIDMGHPLIAYNERVNNSFSISSMSQFFITTGANMSGKSTFLRTVGINLVLAVCGSPVCARSFRFKPLVLFSSMRTSDNLVNHVSFFQAELLRLQQMVQLARQGTPMIVILDEILKGTNSRDKLAGSRLFLLKMLEFNMCGIIATHDLALGDLEQEKPGCFHNICFEVTIDDNQLQFDYKLKTGIAQNMNATWLLNRMLNEGLS
jgi:DNA mismatch repair ATPase MutS